MFPETLQFQLSDAERDLGVLLPQQCLCLRQTSQTLEFLWRAEIGTNVYCVSGLNLGVLRRAIMHGTCTTIQPGPFGPAWSRCLVTGITDRLGWTRLTQPMARDPNPAPEQFWQFETGFSRDLWRHNGLSRFAIPRNTRLEKFLAQMEEQHSYILDPVPGTFHGTLAQLKAANFRFGAGNRFTQFRSNPYPAGLPIDQSGYAFQNVEYVERNLASRSEWNVLLDFRPHAMEQPRIPMGL